MGRSINQKLAKRIKEVRARQGITQEELAELIKTSYKYVQRIEGKNPPDIRLTTVEKIATALRTTPADLLNF